MPHFYSPTRQAETLKVAVDVDHIEVEILRQLKFYRDYYGQPRKVLLSPEDFDHALCVDGIICEPNPWVPEGCIWVLG